MLCPDTGINAKIIDLRMPFPKPWGSRNIKVATQIKKVDSEHNNTVWMKHSLASSGLVMLSYITAVGLDSTRMNECRFHKIWFLYYNEPS